MGGVGQAIGGVMSGVMGTDKVAQAQGAAGNALLGQQQQNYQSAMPTDAEMQQLQQAMSVNQQGINQSQQLIQSADPALMAAGQQALRLMNGESSASLAPIQNERSQQRAQLEQQLAQQLGSGYKTSSAGIQALNNFDQATTNSMTQAQQSTLGQFLGVSQNAAQMGMGGQQQGISNISGLTNQQQGMQLKALQYAPNPALAYQGQIAGAQANAQGMGQLVGMVGSNVNTGMKVAAGGMWQGGRVPGPHGIPGNHPANDTMMTLLSPGEGVIKKTDMTDRKRAHAAVDKMFDGGVKGKVRKGKNSYWDGSAGTQQPAPPQQDNSSSFWDNAKSALSNAFADNSSSVGQGVTKGMDPAKAKKFQKGFNGD